MVGTVAFAEKTGKDIYFDCQDSNINGDPVEQLKFLSCVSYIDGMYDMYILFNDVLDLEMSCPPPKGLSVEQLRLMVLQYIKENPKEMNETARTVLLGMINNYYPCKKKP